jgi:putative transposase
MDGRARCQENIFIERLWWTFKHQYIDLHWISTATIQ